LVSGEIKKTRVTACSRKYLTNRLNISIQSMGLLSTAAMLGICGIVI